MVFGRALFNIIKRGKGTCKVVVVSASLESAYHSDFEIVSPKTKFVTGEMLLKPG